MADSDDEFGLSVGQPVLMEQVGRVRDMPAFYEFFAGGGMVRAGLGESWNCLFANDFSEMKVRSYAQNWGSKHIKHEDVARLGLTDLPGSPDMIWGSFPCQDLSLAGEYRGLGKHNSKDQTRSGTFWPFWKLVRGLISQNRIPKVIVLENVFGILTSNQGLDFVAIAKALAESDYYFGAVVVDAKLFVPQSRPRVFVVAVHASLEVPEHLKSASSVTAWTPQALEIVHAQLPKALSKRWVWWNLPMPIGNVQAFSDLLEEDPTSVKWHSADQTAKLLSSMSPVNRRKVEEAKRSGGRKVGTIYRRTRPDPLGGRSVRAEIRFDEVAGCLRTPSGGSSRQKILIVEGRNVKSRLLSSREAARLMGLPDTYILPERYNDAYHIAGDGVVVPVIRHLASELLEKILSLSGKEEILAAE